MGDAAENAVWEPELAPTAAKSSGRGVRGSFCVLTPEMANVGDCANWLKLWRGGSPPIRSLARGITPSSHVTQDAKDMTNAGRALAAGLVAGACSLVGQVIQTLESGSGA